MPESFGARLRRQREEQKISLATIAEQTKIKMSVLEGLERDDVSHWPSGIFRRAYVRAYAAAIGLSPDAVVREFVELYPEPGEDLSTISAAASGTDPASGGPPTRIRYLFGSALGSLSRFRRAPAKEIAAFEATPEVVAPHPDETLHIFHPGASADDSPAAEPPAAFPDLVAETPPALQDLAVAQPGIPDLVAVARLCTELARVDTADRLESLLGEVAALLDASGLVVWLWDPSRGELRGALAHGYSEQVLAHLPAVPRDADNATAAAFRSGEACVIRGDDQVSGALVIPLLTPRGSAGVLALELQHGAEQTPSVCAIATIYAAMLAQLIGDAQAAEDERDGQVVSSAG